MYGSVLVGVGAMAILLGVLVRCEMYCHSNTHEVSGLITQVGLQVTQAKQWELHVVFVPECILYWTKNQGSDSGWHQKTEAQENNRCQFCGSQTQEFLCHHEVRLVGAQKPQTQAQVGHQN